MSQLSESLAALPGATPGELRSQWRQLYRTPAPALSPDLLARGIAYRLQEKRHGGLPAHIERELIRFARDKTNKEDTQRPPSIGLRPGVQLVRSWRGETHRVLVTEEGFVWNGLTHASLTSIALAITGTRWSGPRFFGLKVSELRNPQRRRTMARSDRVGRLRCAIYTRKSTEEGLEQEFNSLDAQREACAAYIMSQRQEGWALVPENYDDGGFSGGSMDRPGLQQLLADICAGKIDVIVVYKVDRLTRSLADFAKIVEILDEKGASFVSITQAFNTTTSMGRLTLNVLLSFAQFEREVTGERIRDKIAASKKKGLWMGGPVPLGYKVHERKLVVNETEAETVRHIFRRYLELSSVRKLIEVLEQEGIRTKVQIRTSGPHKGGIPFARGSLYHLLKNRTYRGEIIHKGESFPGEHEAIVSQELWTEVQEKLAANAADRTSGGRAKSPSLLAGLIYDARGRKMSPSHASKQGKRYRYYITHEQQRLDRSKPVWRLPARDLESAVLDRLTEFYSDDAAVLGALATRSAEEIDSSLELARQACRCLSSASEDARRPLLLEHVERIDLHEDRLEIIIRLAALQPNIESSHVLTQQVERRRCGQEIKLILVGGEAAPAERDDRLVELIAEAYSVRRMITEQTGSLSQIAIRRGCCRGRLTDLLKLSWLAPDIVSAIMQGAQPKTLTRAKLSNIRLSSDWSEQRRQFGFS